MINSNRIHYIDSVLYSADLVMKILTSKLKRKIHVLDIGVTGEHFVVLDAISVYNDVYQQKLSEIMVRDKANMTKILKDLERWGFIYKEPRAVNKRMVYILHLTTKGKRLLSTNMPKVYKYLKNIFSDITDKEIETLRSISAKMLVDLYTKVLK